MTLAVAQSALTGTNMRARLGPVSFDLPDTTVLVLLLAAVLLTLSSVVQSWLRKFDAILVRRRLTFVLQSASANVPTRVLMSERILMEGWTHWVTAVIQATGFSALLLWVAGPWVTSGILVAAVIAILVGRRFFTKATAASEDFIAA